MDLVHLRPKPPLSYCFVAQTKIFQMSVETEIDAAFLRSAAFCLKTLIEKRGTSSVIRTLKGVLPKNQCLHWDIEERIVGGAVIEATTGKILRSQPAHERECLHCHRFEVGTLNPDGKKKNVFAELERGPGRRIKTVNLRSKKG